MRVARPCASSGVVQLGLERKRGWDGDAGVRRMGYEVVKGCGCPQDVDD